MTEGLVRCHYYWSANCELQYVFSDEVKPQETTVWVDGRFIPSGSLGRHLKYKTIRKRQKPARNERGCSNLKQPKQKCCRTYSYPTSEPPNNKNLTTKKLT